jgi:SRSO17 transposase
VQKKDPGCSWGFPKEAVHNLGQRLHGVWERFRGCFKTQTRDGSEYARRYLSGRRRMEGGRHFTGIGREAGVAGQNIQHFMSESPWSGEAVCRQVQDELKARPELLAGGVLRVDESADEKAGDTSAGAGKQYHGRLGKVETSQVAVLLSYVNLTVVQGFCTWLDGKLFLPEGWFAEGHKTSRERVGIPVSLGFKTKVELAWELLEGVMSRGLAFERVGFDTRYGRSAWRRDKVRGAGQLYRAEVPVDTPVYRDQPGLGIPERQGKRGRAPSQIQVLSGAAVRADSLREQLPWHLIRVRTTERGARCERFAACRVWTVPEGEAVEDWLGVREESAGKYSYALCNAPVDTPLEQLAGWKC